jgi:hypothetical protein
MLQQGVIKPSSSAFSVSVLLVKKIDASWWFYLNYQAINNCNVKDKFLIPIFEEQLDNLHDAKYFTKLNLHSGYHQVRVHPDDMEKTAFRTHQGLF